LHVGFDATVLCGALRSPTSRNFQVLELASLGGPLRGFTTDVVGMEFVRNALEGLAGVQYTMNEIEDFLDAFEPLFDPDNVAPSPIGRSLADQTFLHDKPLGEVVYHLTGKTRDALLEGLDEQVRVTVGGFDANDVHLVAAAVAAGADAICTGNTSDYTMERIGDLEVLTPFKLCQRFGIA